MKPIFLHVGYCVIWLMLLLPTHAAPTHVLVSVLPQKHFVERIGGERVRVSVLVPPGASPATYAVTPRRMTSFADAALLFRVGVPFERTLLPKLTQAFPGVRTVDTRAGITLRTMEDGHRCAHGHASCAHGDDEEGKDPHIWTVPQLVMHQATTICAALTEMDPEGRELFHRNLAEFVGELEELHYYAQTRLAPFAGRTFLVFHPTWGYFADAYGLQQVAVEADGREPSGRQLTRLVAQAKTSGVRAVFVQPQFSRKAAAVVAEAVGADVVTLDPLAEDFAVNFRRVTDAMVDSFAKQASSAQE